MLYYQYPNGSFFEVPHAGSVVYYLGRGGGVVDGIVPFPAGFQMLSGNKAARSYDNETMTWGNSTYPGRPVADRVSFACLTAAGVPQTPYMSTPTLCVNNMRAQIAFQSCWNGVDLYKKDNSHVDYLSQIDDGVCPPTHPIYLPTLFVETSYAVTQVPPHADGSPIEDSRYVFSQGDPTGYGFHGDFINGWDLDVLANAVENCLIPDNFGQVSYCPALYASDTNGAAYNCPEQPMQIEEPVHELIDRLPGCIQITYGPEAASAESMACGPNDPPQPPIATTTFMTPRSTASPTPGASFGISQQQRYLGCFNDTFGIFRTLNSASVTNYTAMTVSWCQQWCADRGYRLSGVEYAQECHCDNYINPTAISAQNQNLTVNQCTWDCGGTLTADFDGPQELCGGLSYINVYNNTDPDFNASGNDDNSAGNAQPYAPAAAFGSNYLGCYTDSDTRTIDAIDFQANNMTIEHCATFCASANGGIGYQYYGLEFASQCFCGNTINPAATLLSPTSNPPNSTCQMRCAGSGAEICGGPNALSLYNATAYVAPQVKPSVGKFTSQTCLSDPNGSAGRALQGGYMTRKDMTVELCIKYCLGTFYKYAGIEYGVECYCECLSFSSNLSPALLSFLTLK